MGLMVCLISLSFATLGFAGVPDHAACTASSAHTGLVSVFSNVDGLGNRIDHCRAWNTTGAGVTEDATITLNVIDTFGNPIFQYPFEDMWLETDGTDLMICNGGSTADASTDVNGLTTFSGTIYAGGWSNYDKVSTAHDLCVVMIDGTPISGSAGMDIIFNTADLYTDLIVGTQDTVVFKPLYINGTSGPLTYDYRVDYYFDHQITLPDLVLYAGMVNTTCP
jgi:hypothetical protein